MKDLTSAGRIIYSITFLGFGINHLIRGSNMAGYVPAWLPVPVFWVYFVGLCLIAAGISIIIKKYARLACLLLALLLIIIILTIHIPGLFNEQTMMMSTTNLLKDIGLIGGALVLAGVFGLPQPLK